MFHEDIKISSRILFVVVLSLYSAAAWFSEGFHHYDEHFQLIEFASYKLGWVSAEGLPWEFEAQSRQAIQVVVAYLVLKAADIFGITSPFTQAFLLRLLSVILCLTAMYKFVNVIRKEFTSGLSFSLLLILTFFLFYMPFLCVRFSSETWSGAIFLVALSKIIEPKSSSGDGKSYFLAGILLGLSFYFRFQVGIMIAGLGCWLTLIRRSPMQVLFAIAAGFIFAIVLGVLADYWFYTDLIFTPYQYFFVNVIEDKASSFGISPWWWYFESLLENPVMRYFNGFLLLLTFLFFIFRPLHPVTWVIIPFVVVHVLIGHKELRFLFPVFFLVPYMLYVSIHVLWKSIQHLGQIIKIVSVVFLIISGLLNGAGFVANMTMPPRGDISLYKYLYHREDPYPDRIAYIRNKLHIFPLVNAPGNTLRIRFYMPAELVPVPVDSANIAETMMQKGVEYLLLTDHDLRQMGQEPERLTHLASSRPAWMDSPAHVRLFSLRFGYIHLYKLNDAKR